MNLIETIKKAHYNSVNKGFWPTGSKTDTYFRTRALTLVITEAAEAVEALRKEHKAKLEKYNNCVSEQTFMDCFEQYVKNSFEDEMADIFIRLCDFSGGFNYNINYIMLSYDSELEALKTLDIKDYTVFIFEIIRSVTDIKMAPFPEQHIGMSMAKVQYLMEFNGSDLDWHIAEKMKYNENREHKHGKQF